MDQMFNAITVHTNFANSKTQSFEEQAIEFFSERGAPTFDTCEFTKDTDRPLVAKLILDLWNRVAEGSNRVGIEAFNDFLLELIKKVCPQAEQGGIFRARLNKSNKTPSMRRMPTRRRRAVAPSTSLRSQFPQFYEGVRVKHAKHGEGVITGFEEDKAKDREGLLVKFDQPDRNGKTEHLYFAHSLHKLRVV